MLRSVVIVITYSVLAGAISLWCFLHSGTPGKGITIPSPILQYVEDAGGKGIVAELLVNAVVGAAVGAFSLNVRIALLCSAFAVLIDIDHTMWYLGFPVPGRPNHSFGFAVLAAVSMGLVFRNKSRFNARLFGIVIASFCAHLSADLFHGASLPLLMPFSAERISPPALSYVGFLATGILAAALSGIKSDRGKNGVEID